MSEGGRTAFFDGRVALHAGDCLDVLKTLPANSLDSCVTDPPYHLTSIVKRFGGAGAAPAQHGTDGLYARASAGFMGKQWDGGDIAFRAELWAEVWRVLKPGAHLAAFSGTRTYHRMACAIEDAGFEIRDQLAWAYGSGFPKSHDVSKGIDREAGAEREKIAIGGAVKRMIPGADQNKAGWEKADGRAYQPGVEIPATDAALQWQGWGTALKPAWEPICLARKPLAEKTVAANVLAHGTGAINVDGCRVATEEQSSRAGGRRQQTHEGYQRPGATMCQDKSDWALSSNGRWPANIVHDGSDEVVAMFPDSNGQQGVVTGNEPSSPFANVYGDMPNRAGRAEPRNDSGSAARFFYSAKADVDDRIGSKHPTVKPVDLMRWLVRLITPPGGTTIDPFAGTGTTGGAAFLDGFNAVLIEREDEYRADIARRMELLLAGPEEKQRAIIKAKGKIESVEALPLFGNARVEYES